MSAKLGNTRTTGKEQYYTPEAVAIQVLDRVLVHAGAITSQVFLEPAGGTGAFVEAALKRGFAPVSVDIEPMHPLVQRGDFLEFSADIKNAICVSNPPFGRNNSLSVPFFNKSAKYSDLIAFIVPRSWRKWSVLNRLDPNFHLVDDWDLSVDYVDANGNQTHGSGTLKTCVQVWKRGEQLRPKVEIPDHEIISRAKPEEADVAITLFGHGCGTVKTEFPRVKNSTAGYFRLNHPKALEALRSVDFSRFYRHTAYIEALSMQEINFLLNGYLGLESMQYSNDPQSEFYLGLSRPGKES